MSDLVNTYIENVKLRLKFLKDKNKDAYKMRYLKKILDSTTKLIVELKAIEKSVKQTKKRKLEESKKPVNQTRKRTKTKNFIDEQPMYLGIGDQGKKFNGRTNDRYSPNYNNNPNTKGYRKEPDRILGNNDVYLSDDGFIVDSEEDESGSENGNGNSREWKFPGQQVSVGMNCCHWKFPAGNFRGNSIPISSWAKARSGFLIK